MQHNGEIYDHINVYVGGLVIMVRYPKTLMYALEDGHELNLNVTGPI